MARVAAHQQRANLARIAASTNQVESWHLPSTGVSLPNKEMKPPSHPAKYLAIIRLRISHSFSLIAPLLKLYCG